MNSVNGGQQEEFSLKWNDHHSNFFTIMQDLCANELLTDVTLACGGEIYETHRLMLCACSNFFRSLLTKQFDKHPIVFLKDVNPRHLELLLQYMYNGEINVLQEDLNPLIETARSLQIKGLSDTTPSNKSTTPMAVNTPAGPPPLKKARGPGSLLPSSLNISEAPKPSPLTTSHLANRLTQPPRSQIPATPKVEIETHESWSGDQGDSQPSDQDASVDGEQVFVDPDNQAADDQFSSDQAYDMEGYVDSGVLGGKQFSHLAGMNSGKQGPVKRHPCPMCGKAFVTPSKLQRHVISHSGIRPFHCPLCGRHFSQAANLKTHIRNTHAEEASTLIGQISQANPVHATAYSASENSSEDVISPDLKSLS